MALTGDDGASATGALNHAERCALDGRGGRTAIAGAGDTTLTSNGEPIVLTGTTDAADDEPRGAAAASGSNKEFDTSSASTNSL